MTTTILVGDVREKLRELPSDSVHCIVTSPPYWGLRDYGVDGQIGLESSPAAFIATMVDVFEELRRVLRPDGTCWVNMGDSYSHGGAGARDSERWPKQARNDHSPTHKKTQTGLKPKDLCMMPHRLAIALQDAGWWVRQDIVWSKPNPMPESVRDRCTKAHEYIFLLTKSDSYYFDQDAIAEPVSPNTHARLSQDVQNQIGSTRANGGAKTNGNMKAVGRKLADAGSGIKSNASMAEAIQGAVDRRNKRSVWTMVTQSFKDAHFATFPTDLPETCIKAGCPPGGMVLDPFFGAGTTGLVADRLQRDCIGIELNPAYAEIARRRIQAESPLLSNVLVAA
jgi:DNA modification methylase